MTSKVVDNDILCDQATYDATKDEISFNILDPINVKGRTNKISIFQPIKLTSNAAQDKARELKDSSHRFIGRTDFVEFFNSKLSECSVDVKAKGALFVIEG
jgi:hypothetical protein